MDRSAGRPRSLPDGVHVREGRDSERHGAPQPGQGLFSGRDAWIWDTPISAAIWDLVMRPQIPHGENPPAPTTRFAITFRVPHEQRAIVQVYEVSADNGSRIHALAAGRRMPCAATRPVWRFLPHGPPRRARRPAA